MTDYTKLVEKLRKRAGRLCEDGRCDVCAKMDYICTDKLITDAAAAIEELQAEVKRLELDNKILKISGRYAYEDGFKAGREGAGMNPEVAP